MTSITREQVIELAQAMPSEKLMSWYQFGLFLHTRQDESALLQEGIQTDGDGADLFDELAAWEMASANDLLAFEAKLLEAD